MTRYRLYRIEPCNDSSREHGVPFREVRTEVVVERLPHWQTWYAEVPDAE